MHSRGVENRLFKHQALRPRESDSRGVEIYTALSYAYGIAGNSLVGLKRRYIYQS